MIHPADSGKAIALFTSGSNVIGITAPIVTGYLVSSTSHFDTAFIFTGIVLAIGAVILTAGVRGSIGR